MLGLNQKILVRLIQHSKQAIHRQYLKVRKEFLMSHELCEAQVPGICNYVACDVHHRAGRCGKLLVATEYFMAVCRFCHLWIGDHVAEARAQGWIIYKTNYECRT